MADLQPAQASIRTLKLFIKHLDKRFVVVTRSDWKVHELKWEVSCVYAALASVSKSEVDPISFELLYKDHLLYDNYNVGDILCDGDNISTQIITPHHSPSLTPVQPATSSINTNCRSDIINQGSLWMTQPHRVSSKTSFPHIGSQGTANFSCSRLVFDGQPQLLTSTPFYGVASSSHTLTRSLVPSTTSSLPSSSISSVVAHALPTVASCSQTTSPKLRSQDIPSNITPPPAKIKSTPSTSTNGVASDVLASPDVTKDLGHGKRKRKKNETEKAEKAVQKEPSVPLKKQPLIVSDIQPSASKKQKKSVTSSGRSKKISRLGTGSKKSLPTSRHGTGPQRPPASSAVSGSESDSDSGSEFSVVIPVIPQIMEKKKNIQHSKEDCHQEPLDSCSSEATLENTNKKKVSSKKKLSKAHSIAQTSNTSTLPVSSQASPDCTSGDKNLLSLVAASGTHTSTTEEDKYQKSSPSKLVHSTTAHRESSLDDSSPYSSDDEDEVEVVNVGKEAVPPKEQNPKIVKQKVNGMEKTKSTQAPENASQELFPPKKGDSDSSTTYSSDDDEDEDEEEKDVIPTTQQKKSSTALQALAHDASKNARKVRQKSSNLVPPNSKVHQRLISFSLTPPGASKKFQKKKIPPSISLRKKQATNSLSSTRIKRIASSAATASIQALNIDNQSGDEQKMDPASVYDILDDDTMWS